MAKKTASGRAGGSTQPGGRASSPQSAKSQGGMFKKAAAKEVRRVGVRDVRRTTTDPFTTQIVMSEAMSLRKGKLTKPKPGVPRPFPGAKTALEQPLKRLHR